MERIPGWIEWLLMLELNELAGKLKARHICIDGVEKRVAVAKAVPTARSGVILPFLFIFGLYILPFPFSLFTDFYEISPNLFAKKIKNKKAKRLPVLQFFIFVFVSRLVVSLYHVIESMSHQTPHSVIGRYTFT